MKITTAKKALFISVISYIILSVHAYSASISLLSDINNASASTYSVGQHISVQLYVTDNNGQINAVGAELLFSKDTLEITSVDLKGTFIDFWVDEPTYSNASGTLLLSGVKFNGTTERKSKIATINFKVKKLGHAYVSFNEGQVLANDGFGTDVTKNLNKLTFEIATKSNLFLSAK